MTSTYSLILHFERGPSLARVVRAASPEEAFAAYPHEGRAVLIEVHEGDDHRSPFDNVQWRDPPIVLKWQRIDDGPHTRLKNEE
jgi:hypothetical protein